MKAHTKRVAAVIGMLALGLTAARAQSDGALLDALVKKGVLTDQEAEQVRADEVKDYNQTGASKLSIANHVTNLRIYGDARYRWEYLDEKPQNQSATVAALGYGSHSSTTERSRYRLRVGAEYTFTDSFSAGVQLNTGTAADSDNQTFGAEYNKFGINVGLVYLTWKPTDWLTLTGGKQKNPLYSTDVLWDPDINPEGGSEVLSWTLSLPNPDQSLTIGLTAGQWIYQDNSEANPTTSGVGTPLPKTDIWQFAEQVPVQFNFNKDTYIKFVPGFLSYTGGGTSGFGGPGGIGSSSSSSVNFQGPHAADHLQLFTAPGEVDWKWWDQPFKLYWDFVLNTEGKARIQDTYLGNGSLLTASASNTAIQNQNRGLGDNIAWVAGLQVGQNKKKGDWSIKADYRQVGLGAVDPNLNDSDTFDSFLNQQGFKVQSIYNFTDFLTGSLTYIQSWDLKSGLLDGTSPGQNSAGSLGAASSLPVNSGNGYTVSGGTITGVTSSLVGVSTTQRFEADLIWKF